MTGQSYELLSDANRSQSVPTYLAHQNQANYRINQKVGVLINQTRPYQANSIERNSLHSLHHLHLFPAAPTRATEDSLRVSSSESFCSRHPTLHGRDHPDPAERRQQWLAAPSSLLHASCRLHQRYLWTSWPFASLSRVSPGSSETNPLPASHSLPHH